MTGNPHLMGGVASTAAPTAVNADGDAVRLWSTRNGSLTAQLVAGTAVLTGDATNGLDVDVTRVQGTVTVAGGAAHDAAVSGNPNLVGAEARTSDGTPVTNGDAVRLMADTLGKAIVLQGAPHDRHVDGKANYTTSTAADVIAAGAAGVRIAVTSVLVTNSHATVSTKVTIRDGSTDKLVGYAKAAGGGFAHDAGGTPLFISTAATAVRAVCGTTGADVDVFVSGYLIAN